MMQKIFLKRAQCIVAGLLYLILFSAYGQNKARLGITGGLNAGQVQTSLTLTNLLWRYNAGVAVEQQLTSNVALAGELIYTRQGSRLIATNGYVSDRYITAFDYIGLPVMLRFRPKGERGFFEVGAGWLFTER